MRLCSLGVLLAACAAPADTDTDTDSGPSIFPALDPCMEVSPSRIQFVPVYILEDRPLETRTITVSNTCTAELAIGDVRFQGKAPDGVFSATGPAASLLAQGETSTIEVTFDPRTAGDWVDSLFIESNDPENAGRVALMGQGVAPVIDLDHGDPTLTAGIGCHAQRTVRITNQGNATLEVSDIQLISAGTELGLETALTEPYALRPYSATGGGPYLDVVVTYDPLDVEPDTTLLRIRSDDPLTPEAELTYTGASWRDEEAVTETFRAPDRPPVDLLVTLDRSSVSDYTEGAVGAFDALVAELDRRELAHRTAVIVDDGGCPAGDVGHIDRSYGFGPAAAVLTTQADLTRDLVPSSNNEERGFMLVEAALSKINSNPDGCTDWLRDGVPLATVHLSDERDQSLDDWSDYVSAFEKTHRGVQVNAIGGPLPSGCGAAQPAEGYAEAAEATGGYVHSICTTDWDATWQDVVRGLDLDRSSYLLEHEPVPDTIEVEVDGAPVAGWTWDPERARVRFPMADAPPAGSTVEITYTTLATCSEGT